MDIFSGFTRKNVHFNIFVLYYYCAEYYFVPFVCNILLGRRQAVSHKVLVLAFGGSNPSAPAIIIAKRIEQSGFYRQVLMQHHYLYYDIKEKYMFFKEVYVGYY